MPRQNNQFGIFIFLLPFIFGMLLKRSNYNRNYDRTHNEALDNCIRELEKLKNKTKTLNEKRVNDFMKMEEWNTIIPPENITEKFLHPSTQSSEQPIKLPLNIDPNWIAFVLQ
jgi:hypothetical protein